MVNCKHMFSLSSDLLFQQVEIAASERERLMLNKISELQARLAFVNLN